jgi:CRISPR-associated endonuclease/helicase Cas3
MNILLVSQCSKKALTETRRILDQFAERAGGRTWQTPITHIGVETLRKLLKKTARRNTSVACHWIKGRNKTELMWIVGNHRKFNEQGAVPTNVTQRNILRRDDENVWHTAEDIALLSGIAALFHDFGKANILFQDKINPKKKNTSLSEPYRHEWVSLRMFQAFVAKQNDEQWLRKLGDVTPKDDTVLLSSLIKDSITEGTKSPFANLPLLAKTIGWLILTHHKLPVLPDKKGKSALVSQSAGHLEKRLTPEWNSPQIANDWKESDLKKVWNFKHGSPLKSDTWCLKARNIAKRALNRPTFYKHQQPWLLDKFTLHLARLSLMLADHHYSSFDALDKFKNSQYKAYANSDRNTEELKQKLDEHLVGVYRKSLQFVRTLPSLKVSLPSITDIRPLKKRNRTQRFQWQDKAFDLTKALSSRTEKQGFFGVNMASTGTGKTLANARIMYALSNKRDGCRFTIALGLRTLTLQTGDALKKHLKLNDEDIAVLIGSQAVKQLYEKHQEEQATADKTFKTGSESSEDLSDDNQYVQYHGELFDGPLKSWLSDKPKMNKLLNAPILVSTIDHLVPATEASRGGKQITPMLRLLTSDLVLDEPDDFNVEDLHALSRLVNWAGLLGSRVVLSSATLTPDIVNALFAAYKEGREHYNRARVSESRELSICCAWFDENQVFGQDCNNTTQFNQQHIEFVKKRVDYIRQKGVIHRAKIVEVNPESIEPQKVIEAFRQVVLDNVYQLHAVHGEQNPQKQSGSTDHKISVGLVRMSNIKPLVALAKELSTTPAKSNHQIHLCVYHSQHPLIVRSEIENTLDAVLDRNDPQAIWQHLSVKERLQDSMIENHIFLILSTSVCEVGRDWSAFWAIAEPSSNRSITQLSGRIQRHIRKPTCTHNLVLLNFNYRGLTQPNQPVYCRPGFETEQFRLSTHDLNELLTKEQYEVINSIPRITKRADFKPTDNLVDLEHHHLNKALFDEASKAGAYHWWTKPCDWTYLMQQKTLFRASNPTNDYYLNVSIDREVSEGKPELHFHRWFRNGEVKKVDSEFAFVKETFAKGVKPWAVKDYANLINRKAEEIEQSLDKTCITFGAINLRDDKTKWQYSAVFGVYQALV